MPLSEYDFLKREREIIRIKIRDCQRSGDKKGVKTYQEKLKEYNESIAKYDKARKKKRGKKKPKS